MAAGGDLHHGLGAAADYALREREREREREEKVGLVVAAGYLLSPLPLHREEGREGRRKLGSSFACRRVWGRVHMTSARFLGFCTPSLPLVRTKSTQPLFLWSESSQLLPSLSEQTSAPLVLSNIYKEGKGTYKFRDWLHLQ